MHLKPLVKRVDRMERHQDNSAFQAAWDASCDREGWPRCSIGDARCLEDLLAELRQDEGQDA